MYAVSNKYNYTRKSFLTVFHATFLIEFQKQVLYK